MPVYFGRYDPRTGGGNLSSSTYNKLLRQVEIVSKITADPPLEITQCGDSLAIRLAVQEFYARISSGTSPFVWVEVQSNGSGGWDTVSGGRSGTLTENPLYELNGVDLPAGTIVRVFATEDGIFWCERFAGLTGSGTIGFLAKWTPTSTTLGITTKFVETESETFVNAVNSAVDPSFVQRIYLRTGENPPQFRFESSNHPSNPYPSLVLANDTGDKVGGTTTTGGLSFQSGLYISGSITGLITDGDKGDVIVSSSGSVWTIDNGVVVTDKIADDAVTADKIAAGAVGTSELATGLTVVTANTGLQVQDTDASHELTIKPGSNLSADRVFTLTTGDAARTLDISAADVTVSSFVATFTDDADASTARSTLGLGTAATANTGTSGATVPLLNAANTWSASQTFPNSSGIKIQDTNASHTLGLVGGSDLSANRTLTVTAGDADRTITLSGDTTLSGVNSGDQNVFTTIAVSGQSDVVADSTSDTLTLAAGSGITVTTNAGTGTVTIAASGVVTSVFGRTGAVTAQTNDYTAAQVTNAAATNTNNTFTAGAEQEMIRTSAADTGVASVLELNRNSSGTPNNGFGHNLLMGIKSTTTDSQSAGEIEVMWVDATHASRKARVTHNVFDTASREYLRGEASGTAAKIGFLGATAAAQQSGDIGTALVTYGLVTSPSLSVANGGTGRATLTAHGVLMGAGTSALAQSTAGTAGQVFTSGGAGVDGAYADALTVSSGESTLGGAFDITGASGTYQATGCSVSLPSAGTYMLTAMVRCTLNISAGASAFITTKLRDTTNSADVSNTITLTALVNTTGVTDDRVSPIFGRITVAGATTIEIYAARNNGTTYTTSRINVSLTKLQYIKVAP